MFPTPYFARNTFAPRYFPRGATSPVPPSPGGGGAGWHYPAGFPSRPSQHDLWAERKRRRRIEDEAMLLADFDLVEAELFREMMG